MSLEQLPVGISDYKKLIDQNCYYVDKTLLIKEIMESGEAILITRPRRFGKTLNQSMMRYFFEQTAEDTSYLFEDKKIWQDKQYREMQGQYPVIYLSFKDVKSTSYNKSYQRIKKTIAEEYYRHQYLLSDIEGEVRQEVYKSIRDRKADQIDYEDSLFKLSQYLFNYYGEKPILLIDEYDTPIMAAYNNDYYDQFIDFFQILLSAALKDNKYLAKSVLTGITRVAKESIFSGLNNLKVSTVLSNFYNDKFGLTREEVLEIVDYYGLEYEEEEIINWYNGYNFGGVEIYNPFSMINLVDNKGQLEEYWINSSGNQLIKDLIRKSSAQFKRGVLQLIEGDEIKSDIENNLVFDEIDGREENIWTLLLFSGYLKWTEHIKEREYRLAVPNQEVMFFYRYTVENILKDKNISLENMILYLTTGEIEDFKIEFEELTKEAVSYFDTGGNNPEKFYHGLVLGMVVGLKEDYLVKSNRETGYGRVDVILIPRDKEQQGIIFEFKKYSKTKDKDLKDSAQQALRQINSEEYETEIKAQGIEQVIKVGIAFKGKQVEIISNLDHSELVLSETEQIAQNLLESGVDLDVIAQTTGLSHNDIEELKQQ